MIAEWKTEAYEIATIVFSGDGKSVHFPGHDFNNGSKPLIVVVDSRKIVVIKFPGGKHWSGNFQPWASHPSVFVVYGKISDTVENEHRVVKAVKLVDFPVRAAKPEEV